MEATLNQSLGQQLPWCNLILNLVELTEELAFLQKVINQGWIGFSSTLLGAVNQ